MPTVITKRGDESAERGFDQRLLIGRDPINDLALEHPRISRHHAMICRDEEGAWVLSDLNSSNGTFVDGARVRVVRLGDGQVFSLGGLELEFRLRRSAGAHPARRAGRSGPALGHVPPHEPVHAVTPVPHQWEELLSLYELASHIDRASGEESLMAAVADLVQRATGAHFVTMVEYHRHQDTLTTLHIEPPGQGINEGLPFSKSVVLSVIEQDRPMLISDLALSEAFMDAPSIVAGHLRSVLCAPLRGRSEVYGVVFAAHQSPGLVFQPHQVRLLEHVGLQAGLALENLRLSERLQDSLVATLEVLVKAIEARDGYTAGHSQRVAYMSRAIGRRLGLDAGDLRVLYQASLLHDIGKIGVLDAVLQAPRALSDEEFAHVRTHAAIGHGILAPLRMDPRVAVIARSHHERWDGGGYPDGLSGQAIPTMARIVAVADSLDAISSDRPYRKGRSLREAMAILEPHAGTQFDPQALMAARSAYSSGELDPGHLLEDTAGRE